MRRPNAVSVTERGNRNALKTIHTVGLPNPESAFAGGSVFVSTSVVMATKTLTAMGTGCATRARMVPTKIASRCRCAEVKTASGAKYIRRAGTRITSQRAATRIDMNVSSYYAGTRTLRDMILLEEA